MSEWLLLGKAAVGWGWTRTAWGPAQGASYIQYVGTGTGGTGWFCCRSSSLGEVLTPKGTSLGSMHTGGARRALGPRRSQTVTPCFIFLLNIYHYPLSNTVYLFFLFIVYFPC